MVIDRDGHVRLLTGTYSIDSEEPEFEPKLRCRGNTIEVSVMTHEPMREVRATLVADPKRRVDLRVDRSDATHTHYTGTLKAPRASRVRIVVTDRARNESDEELACPVTESRP